MTGLVLLWAGMLVGVVMIAVPAQFGAEGLPRAVGIDITRQVFVTFHRVELGLLIGALVLLGIARPRWPVGLGLALVAITVAIEAIWLLPVLELRTEMVLAGQTPPPAPWHRLYAVLEGVKLIALLVSALLLGGAAPRQPRM